MAKIATETFNRAGIIFKLDVHVSADGTFKIALPEEVAKFSDVSKVEARTKNEVWSKAVDRIVAFLDSRTETRKVILFQSNISASIYAYDAEYPHGKAVLKRSDISFAECAMLGFNADVLIETKRTTKDRVEYDYKRAESSIPDSCRFRHINYLNPNKLSERMHMLDWTQEREDFFANLCISFENLILKIDGLTKDKDVFASLVDNGVKMLPAPEPELEQQP